MNMAIGERIRFIRNLRSVTQKWLGMAIGFDEKTADVRMAQYESGTRSPKENYISDIATALNVSPKALDLHDIDSYVGLAHTLFALEDIYGLHIGEIDGEVCLRLDKFKATTYLSMFDIFHAWQQQAEKLKNDEITKEEYDAWRYNYPAVDSTVIRAKIPSEELTDTLSKDK
jgi:transcriptional regulator with XRE-family HTH domain